MSIKINKEKTSLAIYESQDGEISFNVTLFDETIWLSQNYIANLFEVKRPAITKHLKNIFQSKELNEKSTSSIMALLNSKLKLSNKFS